VQQRTAFAAIIKALLLLNSSDSMFSDVIWSMNSGTKLKLLLRKPRQLWPAL
jgi:hypothetical protein